MSNLGRGNIELLWANETAENIVPIGRFGTAEDER